MSEEDANYRRGYNKGYAAGIKKGKESESVPMSLRAFGSPDALASYCITKATKRQCTEWLIAYELLYGASTPQKEQE